MKINWDEAPEGTTHYDTDDFTWLKYDGQWYYHLNITREWCDYEPSADDLTYVVERHKKYYVLTYREDSFSMGGGSQTHIKGVTTNEDTAKVWTEQGCEYQCKETSYKP
jgi:hypothetical protein